VDPPGGAAGWAIEDGTAGAPAREGLYGITPLISAIVKPDRMGASLKRYCRVGGQAMKTKRGTWAARRNVV